jgi:hypothetical protein
MKSGEVKTQKQNYLVFSRIPPFRRNFPGAILPGPLFFIFGFLDTILLHATPRSLPMSTSLTFHGLMEIRPFLSALTVSFNPLP